MLRRLLQRAARAAGRVAGGRCPACGRGSFLTPNRWRMPAPLAETWEISEAWSRWFAEREYRRCRSCTASARDRSLARAVLRFAAARNINHASLAALCADPGFRRLDVAEVNSAGSLHAYLRDLPRVRYSEYGSTDPAVPSEDMRALSYPPASFDLVVSSESVEHVPGPAAALAEVRRVLRPGGAHVFTAPVVWDRPETRTRARVEAGRVVHDLPPSYHGDGEPAAGMLVFSEFGADFPALVRAAGFGVEVVRGINPADVAFVAATV